MSFFQSMPSIIGVPILLVNRHSDMRFLLACQTRYINTIGKRILARRKALGLTQIDLAEAAGVKQNILSDIETGKTAEMEGSTLAGLCRELRLTPEYLVFGHGVAEDTDLAILFSAIWGSWWFGWRNPRTWAQAIRRLAARS